MLKITVKWLAPVGLSMAALCVFVGAAGSYQVNAAVFSAGDLAAILVLGRFAVKRHFGVGLLIDAFRSLHLGFYTFSETFGKTSCCCILMTCFCGLTILEPAFSCKTKYFAARTFASYMQCTHKIYRCVVTRVILPAII